MAVARTPPLDQRLKAILDGGEHGVTLNVVGTDYGWLAYAPVDLRGTCGR